MSLKSRIIENKFAEKDLRPSFPKKQFLLEPTNACNSNCIFCANQKMQRSIHVLDLALAKKVLKQVYQLGGREVEFYGCGEPLLVKQLDKYIACAKGIGYEYIYDYEWCVC